MSAAVGFIDEKTQQRLDYLLRVVTIGLSLVETHGFELRCKVLEINNQSPLCMKIAAKTLEARSVSAETLKAILSGSPIDSEYVHDCSDDVLEIIRAFVMMTPAQRKALMNSLPKAA